MIVRHLFLIISLFFGQVGIAQHTDIIFSKIRSIPNEMLKERQFTTLSNTGFLIDSTAYQNNHIVLYFDDLNFIPQLLKKKKDAISLMQVSWDCNNDAGQKVSYKTRNQIRDEIEDQFHQYSLLTASEAFQNHYQQIELNFERIIKDVDPISFKEEPVSSITESHKTFKAKLKEQFNHFSNYTSNKNLHNRIRNLKKIGESRFKKEKKRYKDNASVFRRFIKGKIGNSRLYKNIPWQLDFGPIASDFNSEHQVNFEFSLKSTPVALLSFDTIYGERTTKLLQIDTAYCYPIDRYLYYKQLPEFDYRRSSYKNKYKPKSQKTRFRKFTVYFDHNKSDYDKSDIAPILKFLNDSSYVVRKVRVEAYASVEGDSVNNQRLQQERAQVLIDLLQAEQKDDLIVGEIVTNEQWKMFFEQIENTSFADWKVKQKEEIKILLENDSIALLLEPILSVERKAVLKLMVSEKLSEERKLEITIADFDKTINAILYGLSAKSRLNNVKKAASIRAYLKSGIRAGQIKKAGYCQLLENSTYELDIIEFYELREDLKSGIGLLCQSLEQILLNAHYASVGILSRDWKDDDAFVIRLRQAVEIQLFIFDKLLNGSLNPEFYLFLNYPRNSKFNYLKLNKFYFQSHEGWPIVKSQIPQSQIISNGPKKGLYYYILKEIVLNDQFKMIKRSKSYFEFELFDFLRNYAVTPWDENQGHLFDDEVDEKVMLTQLNRLETISKRLCRMQLYQLILDYHAKASYSHFQKHQGPNKDTENSLIKLKNYYLARKEKLDVPTILTVAKHLVWYSQASTNKDYLKYAIDLMDASYSKWKDNPDAVIYYLQTKAFDPIGMDRKIREIKESSVLSSICKLFSGKYNIPYSDIADQELRNKLCSQCKRVIN